MAVVEISLDSVASALAAQQGGADRIELCSALSEGGVTPSLGLLRAVRACTQLSLQVLIRPRSGDFLYSREEFRVMEEDISVAAQAGADGVVLGLLTADADVDRDRLVHLVELAHPLQVTFHRAIDMARDPLAALEEALRCGVHRVLTSGASPTAPEGYRTLRAMADLAGTRATVMAGGGVRPSNVIELAHRTGIQEFHASLRRVHPSPMRYVRRSLSLGNAAADEYLLSSVLAEDVRAFVSAANQAIASPVGGSA